jgi:hypothetical protein
MKTRMGCPPGRPPTCPGSTSRGRDSPGHWPARGRPGVGTHLGSPWPRCDIHYESPGVPDPSPYSGFRDAHMTLTRLIYSDIGQDFQAI